MTISAQIFFLWNILEESQRIISTEKYVASLTWERSYSPREDRFHDFSVMESIWRTLISFSTIQGMPMIVSCHGDVFGVISREFSL